MSFLSRKQLWGVHILKRRINLSCLLLILTGWCQSTLNNSKKKKGRKKDRLYNGVFTFGILIIRIHRFVSKVSLDCACGRGIWTWYDLKEGRWSATLGWKWHRTDAFPGHVYSTPSRDGGQGKWSSTLQGGVGALSHIPLLPGGATLFPAM